MRSSSNSNSGNLIAISVIIGVAILIVSFFFFIIPIYRVWAVGMAGKANLRRAEQEKQILVEQAKAEMEAAKSRAEAIRIIGEEAQKYPEYRHQEFIGAFAEALQEGTINQIIYVPTEASIPIVDNAR